VVLAAILRGSPKGSHLTMTLRLCQRQSLGTAKISNHCKVIWPVQPWPQKFFASLPTQIICVWSLSRARKKGVSRSLRTWGRGRGGRAHVAGRATRARTAKSCGPDAPMLASSRVKSIHAAMVANKPVTRESAKETVKPLRGECRLKPVNLWRRPVHFLHEPWVHRTPGIPCAFLFSGGLIGKTRAHAARTRTCGCRQDECRSPDQRSDIRGCCGPACRFAHAGYRLFEL
jgi:hypothetical protein